MGNVNTDKGCGHTFELRKPGIDKSLHPTKQDKHICIEHQNMQPLNLIILQMINK